MSYETFVCCNANNGKSRCDVRARTTNPSGREVTLPPGWVEVSGDRKPTEADAAPMLSALKGMVQELGMSHESYLQSVQRMLDLAVERMPLIQTSGHLCPLHAGMFAGNVELADVGRNEPEIDVD